jgi:hypothetical protein
MYSMCQHACVSTAPAALADTSASHCALYLYYVIAAAVIAAAVTAVVGILGRVVGC